MPLSALKTDWTLDEALAVKGPTGHTTTTQLWAHIARLRRANGDTAGAARARRAAHTSAFCVTLDASRARQVREHKRAEAAAEQAQRVEDAKAALARYEAQRVARTAARPSA